MTTQDKLPPLAEILELTAARLLAASEEATGMIASDAYRFGVSTIRKLYPVAAPYDALIRQQEARIAELEADVERLRSKTHELQKTGSKLRAKDQSDLDIFRNAHRRAYEKLSRRLLESGVGYSRDDHELVTALEAELAPLRELVRDAAMIMKTPDHAYAGVWMRKITQRLAALHQEE